MKSFVIDVKRCNGCHNCQLACKDEHCGENWLPIAAEQPMTGQFWCKVEQTEMGKIPWVRVAYRPKMCAHCADALCIEIAPDAVYRRDDGLVIIDPVKSKGRRDIVESCPFGVVFWNEALEIPQKCTGCAHLIDDGWSVPRCVDACPTGALRLVDANGAALDGLRVPAELQGHGSNLYYVNEVQPRIVGTLVDVELDEVLIDERVQLFSEEGMIAETKTDDFGDFEFPDVRQGRYAVSLHPRGFDPVEIECSVCGNDAVIGVVPVGSAVASEER